MFLQKFFMLLPLLLWAASFVACKDQPCTPELSKKCTENCKAEQSRQKCYAEQRLDLCVSGPYGSRCSKTGTLRGLCASMKSELHCGDHSLSCLCNGAQEECYTVPDISASCPKK